MSITARLAMIGTALAPFAYLIYTAAQLIPTP